MRDDNSAGGNFSFSFYDKEKIKQRESAKNVTVRDSLNAATNNNV